MMQARNCALAGIGYGSEKSAEGKKPVFGYETSKTLPIAAKAVTDNMLTTTDKPHQFRAHTIS